MGIFSDDRVHFDATTLTLTPIAVAIACLSLLSGCLVPPPEERPVLQDDSPPSAKADVKITAGVLIADYEKNALKFRDRILEVNGKVSTIDRTSTGTPFVLLEHRGNGVKCFFPIAESEALARLPEDCELTIKGLCTGKASNIHLERCALVGVPRKIHWWASGWIWFWIAVAVVVVIAGALQAPPAGSSTPDKRD